MRTIFEDREHAGKALAKRLDSYNGSNALIIAIAKGGIPVAAVAAHRLQLEWNIIVVRRLPVPWNPAAAFGAVAADGSVVINEPMVHGLQLPATDIASSVAEVHQQVIKRTEFYAQYKEPCNPAGRNVIIIDDGLASGYTMLAAIKSLRKQSPSKVIAASPVASRYAAKLVDEAADECIFEIVSPSVPFSVADHYLAWPELTDDELITYMQREQAITSRS